MVAAKIANRRSLIANLKSRTLGGSRYDANAIVLSRSARIKFEHYVRQRWQILTLLEQPVQLVNEFQESDLSFRLAMVSAAGQQNPRLGRRSQRG